MKVKLLDQSRTPVATAQVTAEDGFFSGKVDLSSMPPALRQTFEEYEELVNGQMFSLLDEIEERIAAVPIVVVFEDSREARVTDLQIYPSTGLVSFRVTKPTPAAAG
jgi:hypothetical protein